MMNRRRTRIKICGITRPADGVVAALAGADAIGLVFYPPSPRHLTLNRAAEVIAALPPLVTTVALMVDPTADEVAALLRALPVDLLQFHGNESPELCDASGHPYIKAFRMAPNLDLATEMARYPRARGFLVDAWQPGEMGGTGHAFDWSRLSASEASRLILAGGLTIANISNAIHQLQPWAVDVSSGVEASRGVKDPLLIQQFIAQVNEADQRL
jgi:phosphoribosylanthranilate isomerase